MACRFPAGADSPERYWENLLGGVDGAKEIPPDRWDVERFYDPDPDAPGKSYVRKASFIEGVDLFDADFFGISPREASSMDPQQRVLLETAWEAIERAGVAPHLLFQSRTGVYVGVMASEYFSVVDPGDAERIGPYTSTGLEYSLAAGRLSYALGLQGPSFVVGSACSSSLVATHLAMNALRNGECEVALAAGVSLILAETAHLVMSKNRALAADGISS
jgi:acyl transferase domain-containing protein